jgi:lysozyme
MASIRSLLSRVRFCALAVAAAAALAGCAHDSDVLDRVETPHKSQFTGPFPQDFAIRGIDVSKYQGDVDWRAVRSSGVRFAWIKATEGGDRVDPKFWQNWEGAKAAGIARGAYHFVYWCRPWQEEVAWFERNVPVERDALPPVLDVETTPDSRTCRRVLYRDQVLPELRGMLAELERHYGKRPMIYSSVDFYQAILRPDELSEYPIWIRSTKYSPHVKYGDRRWHFWQYQSDAFVPGIRGKVDRNAFFGDEKQWTVWLNGGPQHGPTAPAVLDASAAENEPALQAMQLSSAPPQ